MAIPIEDYKKVFSRPGRKQSGDDGFALTSDDENALDKAWDNLAKRLGVEQLPDQPSEGDIREGLV